MLSNRVDWVQGDMKKLGKQLGDFAETCDDELNAFVANAQQMHKILADLSSRQKVKRKKASDKA